MDATSVSPPRVVHASSLHNVWQSAWFAIACVPLMAASAVYLLLHRGQPHEHDPWWGACVAGLFFGLAFGGLIPALVAITAGTWIADERGIEFIPYTPRLRRWRYLQWSEVDRVQWLPARVSLHGGDGSVIHIGWRDIRPGDRHALEARIEASLLPHFDLSLPPPPEPASMRSVVTITALPASGIVFAYAMAMRDPQNMTPWVALMFAWLLVMYAMVFVYVVRMKRNPRSAMRWRPRRSPPELAASLAAS